MKKRILSLLLVLVLLVTVSVFAVEATGTAFNEDNADPDTGVVNAYCEACETDVDWTPVEVVDGALVLTGHDYVPSNSELSTTAACSIVGTNCLYLNGTVTLSSEATARMFLFDQTSSTDSVLNIMGSTDGKIKNENTGMEIVYAGTKRTTGTNTFAMYGGTLDCKDLASTVSGPAFRANNNGSTALTFNMHGGTINGAKASATGGAIRLGTGATFNMYGGTINGAECKANGGTIYIEGTSSVPCVFNMEGGTIQGGIARFTNTTTAYGGNLYLKRCAITISGGHILNGKAQSTSGEAYGGNIYADSCSKLEISGTAEISSGKAWSAVGETAAKAAYGGNIYAKAVTTFNIKGGTIDSGDAKCFGTSSAHGGNIYTNSATALAISGGTIENGRTRVSGAYGCQGGNVYSNGSVTMTAGTIQNGYTLQGSSNYTADTNRGGNVYVAGNTFAMNGGTIQRTSDFSNYQAGRGGNVYVNSTFNMTNGTITDGKAANGGNIYVAGDKTLTVSGGTVSDGAAETLGGNVYVGGTFTLSSGVVSGGSAGTAAGKNVVVANNDTFTGLLNIANGFTGVSGSTQFGLYVYIEGTEQVTDGVIYSERAAATNGYTNGGKVFVTTEDTAQTPVVGNASGQLVAAGAVDYNGTVIQKFYETAQDAVNNSTASYVQLRSEPSGTLNITKEVYLDVNGYDVELNITSDGKLYGMDSNTNDYSDTDAASVTLADESAEPQFSTEFDLSDSVTRKYLWLDGGFHRYYLSMNAVGLRPYNEGELNPGLLYGAVFYGDDAVATAINTNGSWGIKYDYTVGGVSGDLDVPANKDFVAGSENVGRRASVYGFLSGDQTVAQTQITGTAYITIGDKTVTCSNPANKTMQDVISLAYNLYNSNALSTAQRTVVQEIDGTYGTKLNSWWGLSLNG